MPSCCGIIACLCLVRAQWSPVTEDRYEHSVQFGPLGYSWQDEKPQLASEDVLCPKDTSASCKVFDCFGWRGNTTCQQGRCLCEAGLCADEEGFCRPASLWEPGVLASNFALEYIRFAGGERSTISDMRFSLFQLPGEGGKQVLCNASSKDRSCVSHKGRFACNDNNQGDMGCNGKGFLVEKVVYVVASDLTAKELSSRAWPQVHMLGSHSEHFAIEFDAPYASAQTAVQMCGCDIVEYDKSCLGVVDDTIEFFPGTSSAEFCGWHMCRTHDDDGYENEGCQGSFLSSNHFDPKGICRFFANRTCETGRWAAHPPLSLGQDYQWHIPPIDQDPRNQSDDNLTCEERKILGPDRSFDAIFFSMLIIITFAPIAHCGGWLIAKSSHMACCSSCYWCTDSANCDCCALCNPASVFPSICCVTGNLIQCCAHVMSLGLAFIMTPILVGLYAYHMLGYEKHHTYNMQRQILFCMGGVGFTWFSFPVFLISKFVPDVKSICGGWPDLNASWKPLPCSSWTFGTKRLECLKSQAQDFFVDFGTLYTNLSRRPVWFSALWALTVMSSLGTMLSMFSSDQMVFRKAFRLNMIFEHLPQVCLSIYAINAFSGVVDEFTAYSLISSSLHALQMRKMFDEPIELTKSKTVLARSVEEGVLAEVLLCAPAVESM